MSAKIDDLFITVRYTAVCCGACGVRFALDETFRAARQEDGTAWYCPNGHARVYRDSDVVALQRKLDQSTRDANAATEWRDREIARLGESNHALRRTNVAKSGHLTRLRKRVAAGKCPCCQKRFNDLAEHVASEHPGYGETT